MWLYTNVYSTGPSDLVILNAPLLDKYKTCQISDSLSGGYEELYLLWYDAV
jgi:hypothetical protein